MTTTPAQTPDGADKKPPPKDSGKKASPPDPPAAAVRTYTMLRLSMIGVLIALAISVVIATKQEDGSWCWQPSISAYYYTPTRAVLVAALVTLGTCMIVLWGKNRWEDASLNLAGLLAPVVAFVPTSDANYCGVAKEKLSEQAETSDAAALTAQKQVDALITATHRAIDNNVQTLAWIVGLSLLALLVLALQEKSTIVPRSPSHTRWVSDPSFYFPWGLALLALAAGVVTYNANNDWFYDNAHGWSATTMFVFIIIVVVANAYIQWKARASRLPPEDQTKAPRIDQLNRWARAYIGVAALMVLAPIVVLLTKRIASVGWFDDHWVLVLEATLIALFVVFWILQTLDRHGEGAPRDPLDKAGRPG